MLNNIPTLVLLAKCEQTVLGVKRKEYIVGYRINLRLMQSVIPKIIRFLGFVLLKTLFLKSLCFK